MRAVTQRLARGSRSATLQRWQGPSTRGAFANAARLSTQAQRQQQQQQQRQPQQVAEQTLPSDGVILSAIQPTGTLHIGNYLGAISNWAKLQVANAKGVTLFSIADLHALTVPQEPSVLRDNCREMTANLLACGINPKQCALFLQSEVSAHTELAWLLGCITPMSLLKKMTQFKDKSQKQQNTCLGLFSYPVLMAADILVYRASWVPVGNDQVQHLELARDIAEMFNKRFGTFFPLPRPLLTHGTRIMSLRDGTSKMSKSAASDMSRINLTDSADVVAEKVKKATTDSTLGITLDPKLRPAVANLIRIFSEFSGQSVEDTCMRFSSLSHAQFKDALVAVLVEKMCPVGQEILRLRRETDYLDSVLAQGAEIARQHADATLREVRSLSGLVSTKKRSS